jgi:glycosyltransferase involved in cell wall biosynthesis
MTGHLKILLLLPFAPDLQGTHGGTRATAAIIDLLSGQHRVAVLYLEAPGDPPPRSLPPNCEQVLAVPMEGRPTAKRSTLERYARAARKLLWGRPEWVEDSWSPAMASRAAAIAAEFEPDVIHYEFHVMAQYIPFLRPASPRAAAIVTEHEPGITADAVHGTSMTIKQRLRALARRLAWSRYERRALRAADAIIVFTSKDGAALEALLGPARPPIDVIPLRLPGQSSSPAAASAPVQSDFVFVGNFRHPPNADAARRLVQNIFPMILRQQPEATLTIVGADPPQDLVDAASDRVVVTGWVEDPSIYLAGAKVVLVPLRQGGGLRVKMLEACAAGKAIVASPMAVEGLSLRHDEDVRIAITDGEFAASALALLADPEARARLERASRRWWEDEQDGGRWFAQYADLYRSLGKSG